MASERELGYLVDGVYVPGLQALGPAIARLCAARLGHGRGFSVWRVSTQAPPLPIVQPAGAKRSGLIRRARTLSILTIGWMTVEAGVAVAAALAAGSVALLGFGLDSLIELASATTILWLYSGGRDDSAAAERRAQQVVAICFAALGLYLAFDAITALAGNSHPHVSWPGAVVSASAILVMPMLARAKGRVATQLGSGATAGDAAQSWLSAIIAAAALVSIVANAVLGWWWLDPIAGLGIAGLAVREGREAWAGEVCAACAQADIGPAGYADGP